MERHFAAFIIICLAIFCAAGAFAQSIWNHNGSQVSLSADGTNRRFYYENPRLGMQEVGVQRGTLLFDGRRSGNRYSGTAYVFSKRCGAFPYQVSGQVSADDRSVTLVGRAPQVDGTCRVVAYRDDILTFNLVTVSPPVVARTDEFDERLQHAKEIGRREAEALYNQQREFDRRALDEVQRKLAASENALRLAEAAAQNELRRIEPAAEHQIFQVSQNSNGLFIQKNSNEALTFGIIFVAFVSWMCSVIAKTVSNDKLAWWRQITIESIGGIVSGVLLYSFGLIDEVKWLTVPLVGGLSIALYSSAKHA